MTITEQTTRQINLNQEELDQLIELKKKGDRVYCDSVVGQLKSNLLDFLVKIDPFTSKRIG